MVTSANAPYTTTLDATDGQPGLEAYFDTFKETSILFDLATMRIVDISYDLTKVLEELRQRLE